MVDSIYLSTLHVSSGQFPAPRQFLAAVIERPARCPGELHEPGHGDHSPVEHWGPVHGRRDQRRRHSGRDRRPGRLQRFVRDPGHTQRPRPDSHDRQLAELGDRGRSVPITYTVTNQGSPATVSDWADSVYLSPTPTFDATTATFVDAFATGTSASTDNPTWLRWRPAAATPGLST